MKEELLESETESQSCVSPLPPVGVLIKQENQEDNYSDLVSEVDISRTNSDISLTSSPAVKLLDK